MEILNFDHFGKLLPLLLCPMLLTSEEKIFVSFYPKESNRFELKLGELT